MAMEVSEPDRLAPVSMPLLDISPNVPRLDCPTRKRSLDDFMNFRPQMDQPRLSGPFHHSTDENHRPLGQDPTLCYLVVQMASSPAQSNPAVLTDGRGTPAMTSPSPNPSPPQAPVFVSTGLFATECSPSGTPSTTDQMVTLGSTSTPTKTSAAPTGGEPPPKRPKLTPAEKEEEVRKKAEEKEKKQKEKEEEVRKKQKDKEEEVRKKTEEKEKKQKEKEEENRRKAAKRREREEEARKVQEAKEKKERSQLKLASFFKTAPSTPSKKMGQPSKTESPSRGSPGGAVGTPQKNAPTNEPSEYDKIFKPFFVKEHVTLARNAFEMDEAATQLKSRKLDEFVTGHKLFEPSTFFPTAFVNYFSLPSVPPPRGRPYPSVKKIMAMMSEYEGGKSVSAPIDLTSGPEINQVGVARRLLREVPIKYIGFSQDVRPAYCGTISTIPPSGSLRQLARRPISRDLLPLQYDYDSEAEWVDDGDGEDIDGLDDEEEDLDDDEDMDDFLDDSEDNSVKRPLFAAGLEPDSSGLCFENRKRLGLVDQMYKYRMEFILGIGHHHSIDPFSSHYWEPVVKTAPAASATLNPASAATQALPAGMKPPSTLNNNGSSSSNNNNNNIITIAAAATATNAFAAIAQGGNGGGGSKKWALVPTEMLDDFKRAILKYPKLSKVGLVEMLSSEFTKCTKAQIRNSVEAMAERSGTGHDKVWRLKVEHAF